MSITIQLDLPEPVASEARGRGLLEPARLTSLIQREVHTQADQRSFFEIARNLHSQPGQTMTMEEIQAEVDAARAKSHSREAGRLYEHADLRHP